MFARILLAEDDEDLLKFFTEEFIAAGFTDVVQFRDSHNITARIAECLDRPCILVSDYYIDPAPPTRYVPEMRRLGINIPVVVISAKVKFEQLNGLLLRSRLSGFFTKTLDPDNMIANLCQHLADLNEDANKEYEIQKIRQEVDAAFRAYTPDEVLALRGYMSFKTHGEMEGEFGISNKRLYSIRQEYLALLEGKNVPMRYFVISEWIEDRCRVPR